MNIHTLISGVADQIADSSAVSTWCNTNYGQDVAIYLGYDYDNPPDADACPFVILTPLSKTVGWETNPKSHQIGVITTVYDSSTSESQDNELITEFTGMKNSEDFRKLIETEIATYARTTDLAIRKIDIHHDPLQEFPYFVVTMMVELTFDWVSGSDPLL